MTELRQKYIDELELRGFSPGTIDNYVRSVANLARYYKTPPNQLSDEEIKGYLLHQLREKKWKPSTTNVAVAGIRQFYHPRVVLRGYPTENQPSPEGWPPFYQG